jgi:hypothetical protein
MRHPTSDVDRDLCNLPTIALASLIGCGALCLGAMRDRQRDSVHGMGTGGVGMKRLDRIRMELGRTGGPPIEDMFALIQAVVAADAACTDELAEVVRECYAKSLSPEESVWLYGMMTNLHKLRFALGALQENV